MIVVSVAATLRVLREPDFNNRFAYYLMWLPAEKRSYIAIEF